MGYVKMRERVMKGKQAMGLGKVQSRGQVTIPQEVRLAAGVESGDVLWFQVVEKGHLKAIVLPRHASIDQVMARFGAPGSLDSKVWTAVGDDIADDVLRESDPEGGRH